VEKAFKLMIKAQESEKYHFANARGNNMEPKKVPIADHKLLLAQIDELKKEIVEQKLQNRTKWSEVLIKSLMQLTAGFRKVWLNATKRPSKTIQIVNEEKEEQQKPQESDRNEQEEEQEQQSSLSVDENECVEAVGKCFKLSGP
jgi:hypothetical protein